MLIIYNFFLGFIFLKNLIYFKSNKKLIKLVFGMIIVMILEVFSIGIIYPIITIISDTSFLTNYNFLNFLSNYEQSQIIFYILFFLVIIFFIKNIFVILFIIYKSTFLQNFLSSLRFRLYNMYTNQDYKSFIEKDTPEIIRNIHVETTVTMRSLDAYLNIFAESFILVGFIFFLFFLAPLPTLIITLAFFLFFLIYIFLLKKKIFELGKERVELDSDLIREIEQGLGNYKEIIIYNIKNIFLNRFFEVTNKLNKNMRDINVLTQLTRVILEQFGIIIIITLAYILFFQKTNFLDVIPLLGSYVYAFFKILPSVNKIITNIQAIINGKPSVNFLTKEIQRLSKLKNNQIQNLNDNNLAIDSFKKNLIIKDLNYSHNNKVIFKNLNLIIKHKEKIGIIGPSGSGKSTLLNLIMGFLNADQGMIKYEDINIRDNRNKIGYVSQNTYIMKDTLKNNITLRQDAENIDSKKLNQVIISSGLESFLNNLPEGLNTLISESGYNISGGELQRIMIARALYFSKEILIFDEFTSSLDPKTEDLILQGINSLNMTMIIVSHKLTSLKNCDKIYKLNNNNLELINVK